MANLLMFFITAWNRLPKVIPKIAYAEEISYDHIESPDRVKVIGFTPIAYRKIFTLEWSLTDG